MILTTFKLFFIKKAGEDDLSCIFARFIYFMELKPYCQTMMVLERPSELLSIQSP